MHHHAKQPNGECANIQVACILHQESKARFGSSQNSLNDCFIIGDHVTLVLFVVKCFKSCHRRTCHYGCDNWAMIAVMMYATVMSALRKDVGAYQCHEGYECSFLDLSDCYHINISLIFYL